MAPPGAAASGEQSWEVIPAGHCPLPTSGECREVHAASPGMENHVQSHIHSVTAHNPKPAQPITKFWLQAGSRSQQPLRWAGKVGKPKCFVPKWTHEHPHLLGTSGGKTLPRWEVHSSSWEVTHVSHRRLQQQGMLFKYHADLQEPDGVSLASQQSSQREQRGHGRAEVLLPAGETKPWKCTVRDQAKFSSPRALNTRTAGCCSRRIRRSQESGEALQSVSLPGGFAALGSARQPDGFAAGLPEAPWLLRELQRSPGPGGLSAGEPVPWAVPWDRLRSPGSRARRAVCAWAVYTHEFKASPPVSPQIAAFRWSGSCCN